MKVSIIGKSERTATTLIQRCFTQLQYLQTMAELIESDEWAGLNIIDAVLTGFIKLITIKRVVGYS